ncbi:hypothetical protein QJS04_geneDACA004258 [Acorus gramineus]|uniref:Uncharacterized protein n=1 Tax=Acorus gramineus TaxID=55184 RepID=A0AAV9B208_ACOGR|nr:hypothetical protein QJS04_geneDACA004258 [Acorus gramineus]
MWNLDVKEELLQRNSHKDKTSFITMNKNVGHDTRNEGPLSSAAAPLLWVFFCSSSDRCDHVHDAAQSVPMGRRPFNLIFHPPTTSCVLRKSYRDPLKLGPCTNSDAWTYTPQKILFVKDNTIITNPCKSLTHPGGFSSDSQWFSIVTHRGDPNPREVAESLEEKELY